MSIDNKSNQEYTAIIRITPHSQDGIKQALPGALESAQVPKAHLIEQGTKLTLLVQNISQGTLAVLKSLLTPLGNGMTSSILSTDTPLTSIDRGAQNAQIIQASTGEIAEQPLSADIPV